MALGSTVLWGLWLAARGAVFSTAEGIYHPYYTYALSPAVAALVGAGVVTMWRHRYRIWARVALASGVGVTIWWAGVLLGRVPSWNPWLPIVLVVSGAVAIVVVLALLLAPALYGMSTLSRGAGPDVAAGPEPPEVPAIVANLVAPAQTNPKLLAYLQDHRGDERWAVAIYGSFVGAPAIVDGRHPGDGHRGFLGFDPYPTTREFIDHIEAGDRRYVLIQDNAKIVSLRRAAQREGRGPAARPTDLPPKPPKEFLEATRRWSERAEWATASCTRIDPADYGGGRLASTLWDCGS